MKMIIKILIGIGCLIALILVIALFVKKEYTVERSITIAMPRSDVFDYIKYIKNQDYYNKWVMADPNMKKEFKGTDGTAGFTYAWEGNKDAGKGEQEIKEIKEGEQLIMEVRFIKPFEGIAQSQITTHALSDSTTHLKWTFSSKMAYPMNIMRLVVNMDTMLGKDLETSLNRLKAILEKK